MSTNQPASKRTSPARQLIHPRIPFELYQRFKAYCIRRGISEAAVVTTALGQYLDNTSDNALVVRRLDRLIRRVSRVQREIELLNEFVTVWARMWFAYTPQLPDDARHAAQQSAAKRYTDLLDFLNKRLSGPRRFTSDILGPDNDNDSPLPATSGEPGDGKHQ